MSWQGLEAPLAPGQCEDCHEHAGAHWFGCKKRGPQHLPTFSSAAGPAAFSSGAIIPERPRPIIEGFGWEATHWEGCPLVTAYGLPGETTPRNNRRKRVPL